MLRAMDDLLEHQLDAAGRRKGVPRIHVVGARVAHWSPGHARSAFGPVRQLARDPIVRRVRGGGWRRVDEEAGGKAELVAVLVGACCV